MEGHPSENAWEAETMGDEEECHLAQCCITQDSNPSEESPCRQRCATSSFVCFFSHVSYSPVFDTDGEAAV